MDALLSDADIEEAYSVAYASAVAASAGYVVAHRGFDRDGVDITIEAGESMRPKIDIQLKATINLARHGSVFRFALKQGNYDRLRIETQVPRILVVLHLPPERGDWLTISPQELTMRNCAYWVCLTGSPERDNKTTTTVEIPSANIFDTKGLQELMQMSRAGRIK